MGGDGVGERVHAAIEGPPRAAQGLLRLEHHRELDEVEPPHPDQRPRPRLAGNAAGMREGVARLP